MSKSCEYYNNKEAETEQNDEAGKAIVLGTTTKLLRMLKSVAYNKVQINWSGTKKEYISFAMKKHNEKHGTMLGIDDLSLPEYMYKQLDIKFAQEDKEEQHDIKKLINRIDMLEEKVSILEGKNYIEDIENSTDEDIEDWDEDF